MDSHLFRLVYCSRNLIEGDEAQQDKEIAQILSSARANNGLRQVTGALLFNAGYFAQVLEGPRPAIEGIFERIQRDPRHGNVTVLESGSAEQRDFPNWAMAHVQPPTDEQSAGIRSSLRLALLRPSENGTEVLDLLRSLVIQE